MAPSIHRIDNDPRDYAWGAPGGVARAFGRPAGESPEAELWLGAHASSPARLVDDDAPWGDLAAWEGATGGRLPYLLKLLAAAEPLSLQAHPTTEQAAEGYAREEAAGIPVDARERNYKDPYAKPELIVAVDDGFEALCGFRDVDETLAAFEGDDLPGLDRLTALLRGPDGVRAAVEWILGGGDDVAVLVASMSAAAAADPERLPLVALLAEQYPGDPGIVLAQLLNRVTLVAGECLWLPAGNIHAYLRGTGVELMGPSDNVLRGGLTPKHVDTVELGRVLDVTDGPPPLLAPEPVGPGVVAYRPASVPSGEGIGFELLLVTGDARLDLDGPTVGLLVDGAFDLVGADARVAVAPGDAVFVDCAGELDAFGAGRLYLAAPLAP